MDNVRSLMGSSSSKSEKRLEYIVGVSWPRSGHHMLVRLLKTYFGDRFVYCDFYSGKPEANEIDECCRSLPCRHDRLISFTKSHDFDMSLPIFSGYKYLVQTRDFLPSVVSNFELHVRNDGEDSVESFKKFASEEFSKYRQFMDKWTDAEFSGSRIIVNYGKFLKDPHGELGRVIAYFAPKETVDYTLLKDCILNVDGERVEKKAVETIEKSGVHSERNLSDFRHYSDDLFDCLSRLALERQDVVDVFFEYLHRAPNEKNMINLQMIETKGALIEMIKLSEEYKQLCVNKPA